MAGIISGVWLLLVAALLAPGSASAAVVTRHFRVMDGTEGDEIIICDDAPKAGYAAPVQSGVPLDGAYAKERGADKGLVRLMDEGGRRTRAFRIPRTDLRAIVRLKYDQDITQWADLVYTRDATILVYSTIENGGIFTASEIYRLKMDRAGALDGTPLESAPARSLVDTGLGAYSRVKRRCMREPKPRIGVGP